MPRNEIATVVNEVGPGVPEWVVLMPAGEVKGSSRMVCEAGDADRVINAFQQKGVSLVVDYEHQTLGGDYASPTGLAPAAGWVNEMRFDPGRGLLGRVDWTPRARTSLAAREYRYLSPVMFKNKGTDRVLRMHSAALTNKPAIEGMCPVVNSETLVTGEDEMEELCALLGLAPDAGMEAVMAKIKELMDGQAVSANKSQLLAVVTEETGVGVDGEVEAVANSLRTAFNRIKNPAGVVPATTVETLQGEIKTLRKQISDRECDELIAANSAKLPPAQHDWFRKTYDRDPAFAREWIAAAPALVVNAERTPSDRKSAVPPPADRAAAINAARSKYREAEETSIMICSENSWVNQSLRDSGLEPLSSEEIKSLAIAIG
jgi:phage I-like protein